MALIRDGKALAVPIEHKGGPFDPRVSKYALHVDRRNCSRVVPMEILVLGLSRTGTISIRNALFDLGYFDVYHGAAPFNENPPDADMWVEAMQGKFEGGRRFEKRDWDQLLGHCMGVSDTPCYTFAEELISAYPDAKVILSVRDNAEVWKKSVEDTILTVVRKMQVPSPLARFFKLFLPHDPLAQYGSMVVKYTRLMDIPWDYKRIYEDHNAWVRRLVPPERLLVFNCTEGWEPLCRFLEKDVPKKPFPRRNDRIAYHENIRLLEEKMGMQVLKNMVLTFGSVTGFAVTSWFAWKRLAM